jgi:7-cyano-7-deazaguanine synthase
MKSLVLMSGGLDSTTILAMAKAKNEEVYGLTFNYAQRHKEEIKRAIEIAKFYDINHKIINLDLRAIGGSSLTDDDIAVQQYNDSVAEEFTSSYVPARNLIFLSLATAYAEVINAQIIYCGANKSDYHNYPDCRKEFFDSFNEVSKLATVVGAKGSGIRVEVPLIAMEKVDIIKKGLELGVDYSRTISCYAPNEMGHSCGECLSCTVRLKNFHNVGIADPAIYFKKIINNTSN